LNSNKFNLKKNVLVVAPHADDGELGCGGTIVKLIEQGMTVYYLAFSIGEETIPSGIDKNIMLNECERATKKLGIHPDNLIIKRFPIRKFNLFRQDILEILIEIRNKIKPDIVFMPSSQSLHQDHKTIYQEGVRAFKHTTCYGFDLPWDTVNFHTSCFFSLNENHITKKVEALNMYQTLNHRVYFEEDFINGLAKVRGAQINENSAEAFEIIRIII
jgi:LmbE family N-acetylglucosaminyl deacetylase